MSLNLAKVTRILINFVPWSGEARCAREFLSRISGGKAVATNPDCDVTVRVREQGTNFVKVWYASGEVEKFDTTKLHAQQLADRITVRCEELETRETLQRVGIGKLESAWGVERYDSGKAEIVVPG